MDKFNTFKFFIQENKTKLLVALVFMTILVTSTFMFLNIDSKTKAKTESKVFANLNKKEENNNNSNLNPDISEYIYVDVKGEVITPGVYSLKSDKRVVDAINLAGGLKEDSDTTFLNLSLKLTDQMVIVVYTKDEINNIELLKEKVNEQKEICNLEVKNDACIVNNSETLVVPDVTNEFQEESSNNLNSTSGDVENINNKININTASLEMLITLPKIGQVKAKSIIDYRTTNGNFKDIADIKNVKGIGDSLFEAIKEYITI